MEIRNQPNRPHLPNSDTRPRGSQVDPQAGEEPERIRQRELGKRIRNVRQTIKQHEEIGQRAHNVRQTLKAQETAERIQTAREAAVAQRVQNAREAQQAQRADGREGAERAREARQHAGRDRVEVSAGADALSRAIDESELASRKEQVAALTSQFREGRLVTEERIQQAAEKLLGRNDRD